MGGYALEAIQNAFGPESKIEMREAAGQNIFKCARMREMREMRAFEFAGTAPKGQVFILL